LNHQISEAADAAAGGYHGFPKRCPPLANLAARWARWWLDGAWLDGG
jgi:hypothetical protein